MNRPLKVLLAEDSQTDAELVLQELRRAGFAPEFKRVDNEAAFLQSLAAEWDIILSDYQMPQFSGLRALELMVQSGQRRPFILISGTIGEDLAVQAMKLGAADYLLKDRLGRLGPAVEQALAVQKLRKQRERARTELRENLVFTKSVLDSLSAHIVVLDEQGKILMTNEAWRRFARENGATPATDQTDHFLGRSYLEACEGAGGINPRSQAGIARDGILAVINGSRPEFMLEYDCHSPREQRWFVMQASPLGGSRRGVVISHENITRRKLNELHIRQLSQAVEQSPVSVVITDSQGRIEYVNAKFCEVTGYTIGEVAGRNPRILKSGDNSRDYYRELWETITTGGTWRGEFHNRKKNGELFWEAASVVAIKDVEGRITHYLAVKEDITGRKRMEEEMRWRTALFEAQVDASIDGILVVDSQGRKIIVNERFNQIHKIPRQIAESENDEPRLQFVTSQMKDPKGFAEKVAYLYAHPDEVSRDELELLDGTIVDRYSAPVRGRHGHYYGRIWAFRDITQQRKLEQQLRQSQKMESIGQLAGGIAHDFNNILGAIMGYMDLARTDLAPDSFAAECLEHIATASARAVDLVRQILTFSRQQQHERGVIQLKHVVVEALKLLRASVPTGIEFKTNLTQVPAVLADATAIHQIIMNLGTNAWHAMKEKSGRLTVELVAMDVGDDFAADHPDLHPGSYVRLSVGDTGTGMDRATLERIFEPFFTTKPPGEGTGLGLPVVHGIMKSHEGGISVDSRPGEGTTFHLYFPAIATAEVPAPGALASIPKGKGERILMVDDEEPLAFLSRKALERLGYVVTVQTNALEALNIFRRQPEDFDLVVTDANMPGLSGAQLGAELLRLRPGLPIILVSGYRGPMTDEKLKELGFRELLLKPNNIRTLGECVHRVLHPAKSV